MVRLFLLLLIFTISISVDAQTRLSDTDLTKIKQKSIRKFLASQSQAGIITFEDFRPSVTGQTNSAFFDSNVHIFRLQQSQEAAWHTYLSAHPDKVWQGRIVSCGFIYSPSGRCVILPEDPYPGLESGQIFFIEMRVLCRLIKFPVCFMVTKIDPIQHEITFSYVQSGSSGGAQTIKLDEDEKTGTAIIHSSIHKTSNYLRDKTLYPIYHRKAIKEVHQNIKTLMELEEQNN